MPPNANKTTLAYENDDLSLIPDMQKKGYRTQPIFHINGHLIPPSQSSLAQPEQTLLSYLRDVLHLTGSKLGCAEGGCGACTVLVSRRSDDGTLIHAAVNACLMPVMAIDGCHVTTVEGVATDDGLHPIQERMVKYHGSQCGFCTPGIIMAMYALFSQHPEKTNVSEVEEHMDGNLCRCTGYRPIWDAAKSLCCGDDGKKCGEACHACPISSDDTTGDVTTCQDDNGGTCHSTTASKCSSSPPLDPTIAKRADETFPTALLAGGEYATLPPLLLVGARSTWFKPTTLDNFLDILATVPDVKIVSGNTELGIDAKFRHVRHPRFVTPLAVAELTSVAEDEARYVVGGSASLTSVMQCMHERPDCAVAVAFRDMLRWFASTQIRNVACLGGNLVNASPIADMNPLLMAGDARIVLRSKLGGARERGLDDFFLSYRRVDVRPEEVIVKVLIPKLGGRYDFLEPFKQARRREDDISIVTAGMRIALEKKDDDDGSFTIVRAKFAFGGMAAVPIFASRTTAFLTGRTWSKSVFDEARRYLLMDLPLTKDPPGGQAEYRRALALSFLRQLYLRISQKLEPEKSDSREISGGTSFVSEAKPSIVGCQSYPTPKYIPGNEVPLDNTSTKSGQPVTHASAALHCTGEAIYVDDIPLPPNALHGAFIMASRTHCRIKSIDKTVAERAVGVKGVFVASDLFEGTNSYGPIVHDEELFASDVVPYVGMPLGIVVATSQELAQSAARMVKVEYEDLSGGAIISIDDAIKADSYYEMSRHVIDSGDVDADLSTAKDDPDSVVVEGSFHVGGQEHFYLECHTTLATPTETGLELFSSSQGASKMHYYAARAANLPANRVKCRVKRMGGGFGGKETRSWVIAAAAAFGAVKVKAPVRLTLDRNVDMSITGGRHSFMARYKASANKKTGKVGAFDVKLYSNGGSGFDLSGPVMDRALFHVDGCYNWSSLRANGVVCKTEQPPHTAYRGFGGPQGIAVAEHVVDRLAMACGVDVNDFRRANFYDVGDATHFGTVFREGEWNVTAGWDQLREEAKFDERLVEVKKFNEENKYRKRGIVMLPTKFGIAFTAKFMNQAGSLVHLHQDGTVLISHGGTEMGQGLHTKVCQVAAQAFNIPISSVHIEETRTDIVPNSQPTAASFSTDLYGMATLDACQKILANIAPIRAKLPPTATLAEIATAAFFERVDLSAHGFYILPDERCGYDFTLPPQKETLPHNSHRGRPFNYFTQGVAATEVEINVLDGNHRTIRSDLKVDVGSSINPAIDIGQIEGAFTQGMGWSTIEELSWGDGDHEWVRPKGRLFTSGPGTYKIPAFNDCPEVFNVGLMQGVRNKMAVASSKAIGEPPFFLGASVYFAIGEAVKAARREFVVGGGENVVLRLPATSERIRMACGDDIAVMAIKEGGEETEGYQPKGSF